VAASLGNRDAYSAADAGEAARAALGAVTGLGHAAVGDKTMVDAMAPFAERLTSAAGAEPLAVSLRAAAAAARDAAESTAQLMPKLGRARPHAEKSLGHPDAGAVSFALIVGRIAAEVEAANMSTTEENA
jgi:dihydroxyacetone kinase